MQPYKITTYTAKVYGVAWAGYKASTEYDFGWTRPTREQVIARAGDFQDVTRVELFCTETNVSRVACSVNRGQHPAVVPDRQG